MLGIKLNTRGDTIVEVLIATAVVSIILTGALAVSNSSLKQVRSAQERSEAQAYVQSIVESLPPKNATTNQNFCMNSLGEEKPQGDSDCTSGLFTNSVLRQSNDVYAVTASWDGVTGTAQNLTIFYRVGN
jgi:hypothetical protein